MLNPRSHSLALECATIDPAAQLRLALDPSEILRAQGMPTDPWQQQFLLAEDKQIMLCCCRGAGKSRTTSAKALHKALCFPASLILLIARAQRQSLELFRYVKEGSTFWRRSTCVSWPLRIRGVLVAPFAADADDN